MNRIRGYSFRALNTILIFPFMTIFLSCDEPGKISPEDKVVVINELMSHNATTVTDQDGEYDDWIELYNTSSSPADISGYFITDNRDNLTKWEIPPSTVIPANGFLIIWADEDQPQSGYHCNFKLSSAGEEVLLVTPEQAIADQVVFGSQAEEKSYSRVPNGTGEFSWRMPTFGSRN